MTALTLYDAALWASALIAAVGVIVLTVELTGVIRWLSDQPAREAQCLSTATAYDGGPFAGPGELDYVDDLPFVGAAHANRPTARHAHAIEPTSAAGQGECDGPPPRPDDRSRLPADVSELIEAAAEVRAAHRELPSTDHPTDVREAGEARIGRAHYALEAALARVGGAS